MAEKSSVSKTDSSVTKAEPAEDVEAGPRSLFGRAYTPLLVIGGVYVLFLLALITPPIQRAALFMHLVKFPFNADFNSPHKYHLSPFKTRNFNLPTPDGELLGAWHILPNDVYRSEVNYPPLKALDDQVFMDALKERETIIYFHGNAATRAAPARIWTYSSLSSIMNVNVVAIDYRGFADSTGSPSEEGLFIDARAVFDYVLEHNGGNVSAITIMGQSLGTGVGSGLVGRLRAEGIHPKALVLVAPFSSLRTLMSTYKIGTFIPILSPLRSVPVLQELLLGFLRPKFDSLTSLSPTTTSPSSNSSTNILLIHAKDDNDIPSSHSEALFEGLIDHLLPPSFDFSTLAKVEITPELKNKIQAQTAIRNAKKNSLIEKIEIPGYGVQRILKRGWAKEGGRVVWLEVNHGGHNRVATTEGAMNQIRDFLDL